MVKVGEQGIFLSDDTAKKISPYILSQLKKTLVLNLNSVQSFSETDPLFSAWLAIPPNVSTFTNDSGYLTSFSETDPIYTTSSWYSTTNNSSNWDTAFSWGNHASAGYLTSITSGQVTTALGYTPYNATNPSGYITSGSLSGYLQNNVGISGGTTLIGGTLSGNNLTLSSTSNATKGKILFGTSGYDEVNNRLGIGLTSPSSPLHVSSSTNSITGRFTGNGISNRVIIEGTGAGISAISFAETNIGSRWGIGSVLSTQAFVISKSGDLGGAGNLVVEIDRSTRNMGIQLSGATAKIHIAAGSATAGTAPIKLTSGTNLTTPENGALEYDGTNLYFTVGGVRKTIQLI